MKRIKNAVLVCTVFMLCISASCAEAEPLTKEPGILADKQVNLTFNQKTATNKLSDDLYPAWSPNGEAIAFTSNRSGFYEIWLMNVDGSGRMPLTDHRSIAMSPTWYPSSLAIAFSSKKNGTFDIWRMNIDKGGVRNLTPFLGRSDEKDPSWSPDGKKIVFTSNRDGQFKLYTIDARGYEDKVPDANITILADQTGNNFQPVWSPDGTQIAFVSDRSGQRNIWLIAYPGDKAVKITSGQDDAFPSWSLDGKSIFYSSRTGETTSLMSIDAKAGERPRQVFSWNGYNTFDPEWSRKPELSKILFTSNRDGNNDIWMASIRDVDPPFLARLPVVSPRQPRLAERVTITVRVEDRDSGVQNVYAQIKNADKFVYKAQDEDIISGGISAAAAAAGEGGAEGEAAEPTPVKVKVHMDYEIADTVELLDNGENGDAAAGDGLYTNTYLPRGGVADYYVNIVVKDRAGNTKAYDNVTGFTTKTFVPSSKILLVNDYMSGQRFDAVRYGGGHNRPGWLMMPTESYFRNSWSYENNPIVKWSCASWITGIMFKGSQPRDVFYGESYDEWRILCRGPIDSATLLTYVNSDKCVIWSSPYAGNMWTDSGTITDQKTQKMLMSFLDYGGRLLLTGQDVAWALTKDGKEPNKLLNEYFKVEYISDQSGSWTLDPVAGSIAALAPQNGGGAAASGSGSSSAGSSGASGSAESASGGVQLKMPGYYMGAPGEPPDPAYWAGDACKNQWWDDVLMPVAPAQAIITYSQTQSGSSASEGSAASPETPPPPVEGQPETPAEDEPAAVETLTTNAAGVRYWNTTKNYKTIFLGFGFEAIRPGFEAYLPPAEAAVAVSEEAVTEYATMNNRARLMGSFLAWLRTGRIHGVVTNGIKPLNNAVIEVYLAPEDTKPIYTTKTLTDGSYTILGVDSGAFAFIKAKYPGYYDHMIGCSVSGGGSASVDFKLSTEMNGMIYGRVVMPDGVTPVSRARILVKWTNPLTKEVKVVKTAFTDHDGRYAISDVNPATYDISVESPGMVSLVKTKVPIRNQERTLVSFTMKRP